MNNLLKIINTIKDYTEEFDNFNDSSKEEIYKLSIQLLSKLVIEEGRLYEEGGCELDEQESMMMYDLIPKEYIQYFKEINLKNRG